MDLVPHPEPRFARVAAMIADPTRARMLAALLDGSARTAGELARAAGVTPQTASAHLQKLVDHELVVPRPQGRHRYFRLADADIGRALEALSLVAERDSQDGKWQHGAYRPLKAARSCYGHLAGELGVSLLDGLLRGGLLQPCDGHFALNAAGRARLGALGVPLPPEGSTLRRHAYPCLDWSERRDHLAGTLAVGLLEHALNEHWLRRVGETRALQLTPKGRAVLGPLLEAGEQAAA